MLGMPQAPVGYLHTCTVPIPPVPPVPHSFPKGSMTVMNNKMPALGVLDTSLNGGPITLGEFTVLTGG